MIEPLPFKKSAPFTLGVELELQLVDSETMELIRRAPQLLQAVEPSLQAQIKPEFIQSMVEICTPVCEDVTEVADNVHTLCRYVENLAFNCGCLLYSSSLHPFARIHDRQISTLARYHEIMDDLQLAGRRMITQALHVHVGMPDRETAIAVCDGIRLYLPVLLSLTTSSPFLEHEDTGMYSYRSNLFRGLPRTGIPETLGSWQYFENLIGILNEGSLLSGVKELWWDVRPHPDFGTVEIRICDLPSNFDEIIAVVAFIQAIAAMVAEQGGVGHPPLEIMQQNRWHAGRYGLSGIYISKDSGRHVTFTRAAADLLAAVSKYAAKLGVSSYLTPINKILEQGTSAARQRELYKKHGNLQDVVRIIQGDFWK